MARGASRGDREDAFRRTLPDLIKWNNYNVDAESENLFGENIEDGAVWHLYYGYGSFDEW